jgi:ribosome-binding ATPase YchF (GTP1/OBG family)
MWFVRIVENNRDAILRGLQSDERLDRVLHNFLAGQKVRRGHISESLERARLAGKNFVDWDEIDLIRFAREIRVLSKPTIFVANKMDLPRSAENFQRLVEAFGTDFVIPCSAEAELALRRAEEKKYIRYTPGEEIFRIFDERELSEEQLKALDYVDQRVFTRWSGTGIQRALNIATFKLLRMNCVYPVDDEEKLGDKSGRVLPDVFLLPPGSTAEDLAYQIHSDLAKTMIFAVDARTRLRLPKNYAIRDRDVIKIVAAGERR